jgi:hypothetical protein
VYYFALKREAFATTKGLTRRMAGMDPRSVGY